MGLATEARRRRLEVQYRHNPGAARAHEPGRSGASSEKPRTASRTREVRRLIVDLIDRESWMTMDADVKGDAYEGLLRRRRGHEVRRGSVLQPRDR